MHHNTCSNCPECVVGDESVITHAAPACVHSHNAVLRNCKNPTQIKCTVETSCQLYIKHLYNLIDILYVQNNKISSPRHAACTDVASCMQQENEKEQQRGKSYAELRLPQCVMDGWWCVQLEKARKWRLKVRDRTQTSHMASIYVYPLRVYN